MTKNYYNFLRGKLLFTLFSMCMLFCVQTGFGQMWTNPITGTNPNTSNPYTTGQTFDANITVSGIGRGSGITGANANDRYNANAWNSVALDANDYFTFTLTPNSGFKIDFTSLVYVSQASGTGPTSFAVRSSVDGFVANIGSPISTGATITLTAGTYQNITAAIEFRIYGWGASAAGGTFSVNSFTFNGTVSTAAVAPTVTTPTFANLTTTTADLGGNITSDGGAALTNRGVVWSSLNNNPTIGGANTTNVPEGGTTTGVFTTGVTGLPSSTLIYYKAYAINSVGTSYTSVDNFTTLTPVTPTLTVSATSPSFGNVCLNVQSSESSFTVSGINLTAGPVSVGPLANYQFSLVPGGPYSASESIPYTAPTLASTTVYVVFTPTAIQSYNGNVPVAGGGDSKTSAVTGSGVDSAPTVGTFTSSSVTNSTATAAGIISSIGCSALSTYGIEYSTSNGFANGTGTPVTSTNLSGINFSAALTGLTSSTTYYYHAYATNDGGTNYGAQQSFTTTAMPAPVATAGTNETFTSFDANWNSVTGATGYFLDVSLQSNFLDPTPINLVEFSFPNATDDNLADGGTGANSAATINSTASTFISYAAVGGSNTSAANYSGWNSGSGTKYWETEVNALGYYNLSVSSKQRASNTGPRDFKLQYKIGAGGTYTDVASGTITTAVDWTTGVLNDLPLPAACDNQSSVFLRWIMTSNVSVNLGTVQSGGTSGIDEVFVNGQAGDFVFGYENLSVGNVLTAPLTGLTGNTTYYYRLRAADAGSTSANSNVITVTTLDPCATLAINPTNNGPICQGSTLNLFANPSGGALPYASFQWSGPSGFTSTNEDVNFVNGLNGVYTVTVTDDIGCTISNTTTAQVDPAATVNAGPNQAICLPATATMNGTIGGSATQGTWSTSGDGTFNNVNAVNAVYTAGVADSTNGTVTLTFTTDDPAGVCGPGIDAMVLTIAGGIPAQPDPITGAPVSVCPPSGTINLSTNAVAGATSYLWSAPAANSGVSFLTTTNATSVDVQYLATGNSTYNIRIEAINACGTGPFRAVSTRRSVGVPASVSGPVIACPADVKTYTATGVTGADTYTWTGPAGTLFDGNPTPYTALDLTVDVTFPAGFTTGSICIAANVACFTSATKCITVNAQPTQPGALTGTFSVCPGQQNVAYSVPNVAGATYTWIAPTNASIDLGQGTNAVTVDFNSNFTSGDIKVTATSGCGTSGIRNKTIVGTAGGTAIGRPKSITGQTDALCGTTQVYTANPNVVGATYNWTFPGGTIINNQNANSITVTYPASGFGNTSISVYAQLGCVTSLTRTIAIKGAPASPSITGPASVCANSTGNIYSVPLRPGLGYNWAVPKFASITAGAGTNQITVSFGATAGQVSVNQYNACGSGGASIIASITCRMSEGSSEVASNIEFNAYPNPASEQLNVELTSSTSGKVNIQLVDVTGKIIMSEMHTSVDGQNIYTLDVSRMAKGIYVLNVTTEQGAVQSKLIIE